MKILYTGGGTMGSVSPLIAIHQRLNSKFHPESSSGPNFKLESLWIGTKSGPEREMVGKEGVEFKAITAGKLRRYFDLRNLIDIFKIASGFWQAFFIILKFKPDIILSAGSFVSVPVIWAGWLLSVPAIIHQQDVKQGLANKLMAPFAKKITVALDKSLNDYSEHKTILVGNPVRKELRIRNYELGKEKKLEKFDLENNLPVLLVIGGGTGALRLNEIIIKSLSELTKFCQIIHITGRRVSKDYSLLVTRYSLQYKSFEFLTDKMANALQVADLVISRAGMSSLTELAYFKKPTIIIPIPHSHQEENAEYFAQRNACVYLKQKDLSPEKLVDEVKNLLVDEGKRKELGENINKIFIDYSGEKIIKEILSGFTD